MLLVSCEQDSETFTLNLCTWAVRVLGGAGIAAPVSLLLAKFATGFDSRKMVARKFAAIVSVSPGPRHHRFG
jgi:hypothetical protein